MQIGPLLGILTISRPGTTPFVGGQNESFTEILEVANQMNCVAFVFNPFEIDWSKKAVWGYRFNTKHNPGEWERQVYPLPSIIYNRIPNRTLENREDIILVLNNLRKKYGSRFFNPYFLDKWLTHKILFNDNKTKEFLPETHQLKGPSILSEMVSRHSSVYLKPKASSLGNDIYKINMTKNKMFRFIHQTLTQPPRKGFIRDCRDILRELPQNGSFGYLVQQAVPLARFRNRPFDLRLLVQKDRTGKWRKTGTAARIAGEGSITTHVFYGGTRHPANTVIREAAQNHGFSYKNVKKQLKKIESLFPRTIENAYKQSFGELEMDIGIDEKGKVWFFEANSKPFRFDEKLLRAKSLVRLIHYVRYLDLS
ncbi:YheC/YheD family protein [Phosphitispora sp. TUW77]|uniref:YheC/YheD family endospore coat-associated protein n=1 Tax=Phosphitispora sp. TUW77 TaxID=3152361 RepID=UPI003AB31F6B